MKSKTTTATATTMTMTTTITYSTTMTAMEMEMEMNMTKVSPTSNSVSPTPTTNCHLSFLPVSVSHTDECQRYNATQLSPHTGYLALRRIASKAIQTPTCCWTVRGRPGQIVEVTLLRLGAPASQSKRRGTSSFCPRYVTVKENAVEKRIDVCEYGAREHLFYKSSFHTIQICADDKKQDDPDIARMLFYKGEWCTR